MFIVVRVYGTDTDRKGVSMDGFMIITEILVVIWLYYITCFALVLIVDELVYRIDRKHREREKREKETAEWKRKK